MTKEKTKRTLVLGNFGSHYDLVGGQISRTRNVSELLAKNLDSKELRMFDVQKIQYKKILAFNLFWLLLWCDQLIYLPGKNNFRNFSHIIKLFKSIRGFSIIHIAIGGWLNEFSKENKFMPKLLKSFKVILIQSKTLQSQLQNDLNLNNVVYFPNFRINSFNSDKSSSENLERPKLFKIVFMARITKEKGIDVIFDFAKHILNNKDLSKDNLVIDFYGPIDKKEKIYFTNNIGHYDFISYKGVLDPKKIYNTLSEYDVLLLPTRHKGEGFPGTILDAYISGIPVIVSNWKYLPEFVDHGKSGFIYDLENSEELFEYVKKLYRSPELLSTMKEQAFEKSREYSEDVAWDIIKKYL